jgi:carboxymethylenebutenolidase
MQRKTIRDFDPEVIKAYDEYAHGEISRRGFFS